MALAAVIAALPVACGLWASKPWLRVALAVMLAAVAILGFTLAPLAHEPAIWIPAKALVGLPVVVLALLARLSRIAPSSLRAAVVGGLGPGARLRLVLAPLMLPGALAGGLLVFAAVLADRLLPGTEGLLLPAVGVTGWMMAALSRR